MFLGHHLSTIFNIFSFGSVNGALSLGAKPLPDTILAQVFDSI